MNPCAGKYTIFGRYVLSSPLHLLSTKSRLPSVIDGVDEALTSIERVPVNPKNRPLEPIKLEKVLSKILVHLIAFSLSIPGYNTC